MSLFRAFFDLNKIHSVEEAFGVQDITSKRMKQEIEHWFSLYYNDPSGENQDGCQRIPVAIVDKLVKTMFGEYEPSLLGTSDGDLLQKVDAIKKRAVQEMLIGGECFIKPVVFAGKLSFTTLRRDCFIPFSRDALGRITSLGSIETTMIGGASYTLAERRTVDASGLLTIESRLFRSYDKTLGKEVPLDTLKQYAQLKPVWTVPKPLYNLGMVQLRNPAFNCVDGSSDGVCVYAAATFLLDRINQNELQLCKEFENGASRIIASSDMLTTQDGKKRLKDDVFVGLPEDQQTVGVTIFSPTLRDESFERRRQAYLKACENLIGLKRGILSDVEAAERTATEVTSSQGDYNLTIVNFQACWEEALRQLISTCNTLCEVYRLPFPAIDPQKGLSVDWGDGVLYNRDKTWQEYQSMVAAGLLKPELALAWYFELPCETPQDLAKIRAAYMPEMEQLLSEE